MRTLKEKNLTRLDVQTLISAGALGYTQALGRFDKDRGVKFKTFAEYRIKGAVLDEVRKMIGDERCKNPRPRKVDNYDMTMISDHGHTERSMDSAFDIGIFQNTVDLDHREMEILQARIDGLNLREISKKFGFSESRASQLLAKIKKHVYEYYKDDLSFMLVTMTCPLCAGENSIADKISKFRCDTCDADLEVLDGLPIVARQEAELVESEDDIMGDPIDEI